MKTNLSLKALAFVAVFTGVLNPIQSVFAAGTSGLPGFADFVGRVTNGKAAVVTGVYVPGLFAFPVVAQPAGNPGYVSTDADVVTRFAMPKGDGVIGLLAHNNLAGATFSGVAVGDEIRLVYGDGHYISYWVNGISRYQALQPTDMNSRFRDPVSNKDYSAAQIFSMFYAGNNHLTLQTCIARDGEASWGRLFITAVPNRLVQVLPSDVMNILFRAWPSLLEASN